MCYVAAIKSLQRKLNIGQRDLRIDRDAKKKKSQQNRQNWTWGPYFSWAAQRPDFPGLCWGLSPMSPCSFTMLLPVIWAVSHNPVNIPLKSLPSCFFGHVSRDTRTCPFFLCLLRGKQKLLRMQGHFGLGLGLVFFLASGLLFVQEIDRTRIR